MYKKLVSGIFTIAIAFLALPVFAQKPGRVSFKFSPQFLLVKGYHFEIEKTLKNKPGHSIAFAPHFYNGNTKLVDAFAGRDAEIGVSEVRGYGGEILYKVSGSEVKDAPNELITVTYGVNYHHFDVGFTQEGFVEVPDADGLSYYKKKENRYHEKIDRWGATLAIGPKRKYLSESLFMDLYFGIGATFSQSTSDYFHLRYNSNFLDYGNSGGYFLAGFKVGLEL